MSIQVLLKHRTEYRYAQPVTLGPQVIQLRPAPHTRTPILSYALHVTPGRHLLRWLFDAHGNHLARLIFSEKTREFVVEVELLVEMGDFNPFDFFLEPGYDRFPFAWSPELARDLAPYRVLAPAGPRLGAFLGSISRETQNTVSFLVGLNSRIRDAVQYVTRMEHGVQSTEETLELGSGSCRDSAWLLVEALRHLGFAARFVSGYLIQLAGDDGIPAHDSTDLHAWAEVFLPGAGWIGLDATSGLMAGAGHIPLACTPQPLQAAAVSGTVSPSRVEFKHFMSVERVNETATTARPFTDAAWARLVDVAHAVDLDLESNEARLTMGGEPTFVAIDDPEHVQWNFDAQGPEKRSKGLALVRAMQQRLAPGGMLHYGQGKWYPGEELPRWAMGFFWRVDGVPVWENSFLIALEQDALGYTTEDARMFMEALTRRLEVSSENVLPAYNNAEDAEPAGYVLPLRRRQPGGRLAWSSQLWFERPEKLILTWGDSPIGFRLSVEAMPWVTPDPLEYDYEAATDLSRLPARPARRLELFARTPAPDPLPPLAEDDESATEKIRPSLCVEARNGRLHIFFPYLANLADYLDLVAAVEDTCEHLGRRVWLEGYAPPRDPRLKAFGATPDPGVLEINLPPARRWGDIEHVNTILYEEAAKLRLTTEKFTYDGGHGATGGGNHITLGGASTLDSPFLRRPDLLRSMVTFWQNHPSLSYLFAGMYVGPTSQYPRVDEARMDALYELEVAFSQLSPEGTEPFVIDALFRNLLVDVTGNSHRAEFCVDKLYAPYGAGLQAGLLELRAFEMTPHVRMSLASVLVVRALAAMFWRAPYQGGLVRWGTTLHDRFLLPMYIERDFHEVLEQLRQAGFAFEDKWYAAQMEFRFPKLGSVAADGVELELRQALEPWHVLAEESTSGGTVRSVDSSLGRVQVRLSGSADTSRYAVTCNGRRIPLAPTGEAGDQVAAVRYRARKLNATLHPTVPVHLPLVFDLIDTVKNVSVARASYREGPVYESRPGDAAEAERRRLERFFVEEPSPDPANLPAPTADAVFPLTLDLRFPAPVVPAGSAESESVTVAVTQTAESVH
jgi:uncharacterized protein (DUF2126 family)